MKASPADKIKAIELIQGRIRDLPVARMAFDVQVQSEFEKLSGRKIDDELVGEVGEIARKLNSSELSQAFDEFSALLRDAAEIAAQDGISLPSCLELAEVIRNQDELEALCGKANAELGLWTIALKSTTFDTTNEKSGRPFEACLKHEDSEIKLLAAALNNRPQGKSRVAVVKEVLAKLRGSKATIAIKDAERILGTMDTYERRHREKK